MNDLAPMKNCPGGCKVGQISSRGSTKFQENWSINAQDRARKRNADGRTDGRSEGRTDTQMQIF